MATMHAPAPTKLFREEAKTQNVQCPACGGPITRRGFGAIERVICPYCGSESEPEPGGPLHLLQQAERQRRSSVLPLQARGQFDGETWEVIGIVWRECEVDGLVYPWQEFLLFNPYRGYRWLVFAMTDRRWTIGEALAGAPQPATRLGRKAVSFKGTRYRHFQTVVATTSYVEGEFPWQVHVGDRAVSHEYVAPPSSISIEETRTADGQDIAFTALDYVSGEQIWRAFKLPGSPPSTQGISSTQPNPWKAGRVATWVSMVLLLAVWAVAAAIYIGGRTNAIVYEGHGLPLEPIVTSLELGTEGDPTTLEVEVLVTPLSNAWVAAEIMLVPEGSEEALAFGLVAENWHGVAGGESWQEGSISPSATVGGVTGGPHTLQIAWSGGQGTSGATPPLLAKADIVIRDNVVLLRYVLVPLGVILIFPLVFMLFSGAFETKRWANSDYSSPS